MPTTVKWTSDDANIIFDQPNAKVSKIRVKDGVKLDKPKKVRVFAELTFSGTTTKKQVDSRVTILPVQIDFNKTEDVDNDYIFALQKADNKPTMNPEGEIEMKLPGNQNNWTVKWKTVDADIKIHKLNDKKSEINVVDNTALANTKEVAIDATIDLYDLDFTVEIKHKVNAYPMIIHVNKTKEVLDDGLIIVKPPSNNLETHVEMLMPGFAADWSVEWKPSDADIEFKDKIAKSTTLRGRNGLVLAAVGSKTFEGVVDIYGIDDPIKLEHAISLYPASLKTAKAKLTLLNENTLTIEGANKFPSGLLDKVKFEIKRDGKPTWYKLQLGTAIQFKDKARVAGKFKVRAILDIDGSQAQTNENPIEVQFPNATEILTGAGVRARMDTAWTNTKNATVDNSRREEGYYITLNTKTEKWGIGGYTIGNAIQDNQGPPMVNNLAGARPNDNPASPKPTDMPIYTVGWFHTHTPEFYRTPQDMGFPAGTLLARDAGPSQGDRDFAANTVELPGFVYDYVGVLVGNQQDQVPFGHPKHANAVITPITPPDRRKTPTVTP
jgi:hypothetical protein